MLNQLRSVLGDADVLTSKDHIASYSTDWTGEFQSHPIAVLRPRQAEQLVDILRIASAFDIAVVPQGGNTSLVGGSVGGDRPHLIVSTRELRETLQFDASSQQLTVSAGYTLGEVQAFARAQGLEYAIDLAARDSATIGGTVATNAGGIRVVAHGMTRAHVVGIEMVLSDGEVLDHLNPLTKDNTGPDVTSLAIGSEGTLGVITAVRLQLQAPRTAEWTALIPVDSLDVAVGMCRAIGSQLVAAEVIATRAANEAANDHNLAPLESNSAWWLLVEGDEDFPTHVVLPDTSLLAMQTSDVAQIWKYRELQTTVIAQHADVLKLDVSVSVDVIAIFIDGVRQIARRLGISDDATYLFGHLMDGNIHISFVGVGSHRAGLSDAVMNLVVEHGGAISAEHGIGQLKGKYLPLVRTGRELSLFSEVRRAFDRSGIMNPHVLRQ